MKPWLNKIWFYLLRSLIYVKRVLVWILRYIWRSIVWLVNLLRKTIGFRIYKLGFKIQKYTGKLHIPWDSRLAELIGKRSVLQVVLFVIVLVIMSPHSQLYTAESMEIPGRETLLYKIIGPGEQDFSLEEISVDFTAIVPQETQTWKEGAVMAQPSVTTGHVALQAQEISSVTAGGEALSKPTIIPGAVLPTGDAGGTGRTEIVYHVVEPGDTVGYLAEEYRISVATVLWANNLSSWSLIRPGDKLKILPVSGLVHKVVKNDTISKIAKKYKSEAEAVIKFNSLKEDGSDIVVGEELLIPGGVKPQTVYRSRRVYSSFSSVSAPPSSGGVSGSGYLWPTSARRITQYYGWRHTGLDIGGPVGTPLYASRAGRVTKSQCGWNGGYGCYVTLNHGGGIQTIYAHASRLYVKVGDTVAQGQTIAAMGSTGRSTGSHIHFEVQVNGYRMNPLRYIR